ncbi:MAG: molybdopterin-dependent oxidoreductase [Ilumatobacteraceae bacterium]
MTATADTSVKHVLTACPLDCPDTCSLEVTVLDSVITRVDAAPVSGESNPLTDGWICKKVKHHAKRVYSAERIMTPLIRVGAKGSGEFRPISWDEAVGIIGTRIRLAIATAGPDSVLPYLYNSSAGKLENKFLTPHLFERLGCPEIEHTICAGTMTAAWKQVFGDMLSADPLDVLRSRLVVVWGANPGISGTHFMQLLTTARKTGAKLVVIDPRRTTTASRAHIHLALRPGTDVVLAYALARWLAHNSGIDQEFVQRHASGAEEFLAAAEEWTIERASEVCGVSGDDIVRLGELIATTRPAMLRVGWGMERNRNGGSAHIAAHALWVLAGHFGVRGSGVIGSTSSALQAQTKVQWPVGIDRPPRRKMNMNHVGRVLRNEPGAWNVPAKVLIVQGANPAVTAVDQHGMLNALGSADIFTVVHDQVMTDTALFADVVLPATTHFEVDDLVGSYGSFTVQRNVAAISPVGESKSNNEFASALARVLHFPADEFDASAERMTKLIDQGLQSTAVLRAPDSTIQFRDAWPSHPQRRAQLFTPQSELPLPTFANRESSSFPLVLLSSATAHTVNSMFGDTDPPAAVLKLNPNDAGSRGVTTGDIVQVHNAQSSINIEVEVDETLRPGVCYLPKGLWRRSISGGLTSNSFVSDELSDLAGGACFNDARVEVQKVG